MPNTFLHHCKNKSLNKVLQRVASLRKETHNSGEKYANLAIPGIQFELKIELENLHEAMMK